MARLRFSSTRTYAFAAAAVGAGMMLLASGCIRWPLAHPNIDPFNRFMQDTSTGGLTVRFLGTSSLLFTDRDSTSILMDGFVSRPGMLRVGLWWIKPDCARIRSAQDSLGHPGLAAVFAGHAHYDHAMDAPVWAQMTGATLVGSRSVTMLGRGIGLPDTQDIVVQEGVPLRFGRFELTFIESAHGPPDRYPGTVYEPLEPRARTSAWQTGLVYSVLIRHRGRTILVQSTAGYKPGALRGRQADVVYLAIGGLGHQSLASIDAYWSEVVRATGARRVILVHWDDFFRSLDKPMLLTMYGGDDVPRAIRRIVELAAADRVDLKIPRAWQRADPFDGLPLPAGSDTLAPAPQPRRSFPVPDSGAYCRR